MAASAFSKLEVTAACTVVLRASQQSQFQHTVDLEANWIDTAEGISGTSDGQKRFYPWSAVLEVQGT